VTYNGQEGPVIQPERKRTQKTGGEPPATRGLRKRQVRDEDVIEAASSGVERQVQALMVEKKASIKGHHLMRSPKI